jgi:hypothetical protein
MTPSEKILTALTTLLTRRERERAPARPMRVLGRNEDGTERLQRLDAACVTRGTPDNHYTGTTVLKPATPANIAFHRAGTLGIGTTETLVAGTLWIERLDPDTFTPGQTYEVIVTGRGFDEATRIDFLDPDPNVEEGTVNPDLEILAYEVLSPETLRLTVAAAETARPINNAPIAYGRSTE